MLRIKSNFHDYYDRGMVHHSPDALLYVRKEKNVSTEKSLIPIAPRTGISFTFNISTWTIGFCGKLYFGFKLSANENRFTYKWTTEKIVYSLQEIDDFVKANFDSKQYDAWHRRLTWKQIRQAGWDTGCSYKEYENFFNSFMSNYTYDIDKLPDKPEQVPPLFVAEKDRYNIQITYNCKLEKYEFFRIFDSYRAYQEIYMYLSNQAEAVKQIPPISDEVMAEIKGFDKYSFRSPKGSR